MWDQLNRSLFQTVSALSRAIEIRDLYTSGHLSRTSELARRIAQALGHDQSVVDAVRVAGTLHDIGKIGVPFELLAKPARLSAREREMVCEHVTMGCAILSGIEFPWPIVEIVRQHHERLDGSGYPKGLCGDQIRIESRIVAVADSADSMLADRPYRNRMPLVRVCAELNKGSGTLFDAEVVDACVRILGQPGYVHEVQASSQ